MFEGQNFGFLVKMVRVKPTFGEILVFESQHFGLKVKIYPNFGF